MSTPPQPPRGLRISDADRERAAERLQTAMAEGRITFTELDERLAAVYAARYEAELLPPLADLPGAAPAPPPVPARTPTVLRAGMSGIKRTGAWSVPARLRVQSVMGTVLLDFSRAENPHPVVEIELEIAAGSAKLLLPTTPPPTSTASSRPWGRSRAGCRRNPGPAAPTSWCAAAAAWERWSCAAASTSPATTSDPFSTQRLTTAPTALYGY